MKRLWKEMEASSVIIKTDFIRAGSAPNFPDGPARDYILLLDGGRL